MSRHSELLAPRHGVPRWPRGIGLAVSLSLPLVLFVGFQLVALVLHMVSAAHNGPVRHGGTLDTLGSLCSLIAWLVLLFGLGRVVARVRAARSHRRHAR